MMKHFKFIVNVQNKIVRQETYAIIILMAFLKEHANLMAYADNR